jgi:DNA-binding IclR family transcriptional regulator
VTPAKAKRSYPSAVAVERAADLLELLAERGSASVMELADEAELSGSAVHRILTALTRKGLVEQDPASERYKLSWGLLKLARALVNRDQLRTVALRHMTQLRDLTGETVTLYARSGYERICVEQVEGTHEIRYKAEIGRSLPLYAGASGLALLAQVPPDELQAYLRSTKLARLTPDTITARAELERSLAEIRQRGYAIASNDRVSGLAGLSAPVFDGTGSATAVITIAGPANRIAEPNASAWATALLEAADQVSRVLRGTAATEPVGVSA